MLLLLYLLGVLFFTYRLVRQLLFVRKLLREHQEQAYSWQACRVVPTRGPTPTFSFLRYIFLNENPTLREEEKEQILRHERVHIVQRHSLDLLFLAAVQILFWFNPLLLLYQKALTDTHEFIADEEAVQGSNPESYAQLMVRQLFRDLNQPVLHSFASSRTLSRISMLYTPISAPKHWKKLLVLPVLMLSIAFLIFQRNKVTEPEAALTEKLPESPTETSAGGLETLSLAPRPDHPDDEKIAYWVPKKFGRQHLIDSLNRSYLHPMAAQMPMFKGGKNAFHQVIIENIDYDRSLIDAGADGLVLVSFVLHPDGSLTEVQLERKTHPQLDQKAEQAVKATAGNWNPTVAGGVASPIKFTLPIRFGLIHTDPPSPSPPSIALPPGTYLEEHFIAGYYREGLTFREGGNEALEEFIKENITYPAAALAAKAEGVVAMEVTVKTDGTLANYQILNSKHPALDQEALRVVKATSGQWIPLVETGKTREVSRWIAIRFRLEQRDAYLWNGYWF